MKDWIVPVVVAFVTSAVVPLIQATRGRGRARADAAAVLQDTAQEWVTDFKTETAAARREAQGARAEMQVETAAARREAQEARTELRQVRAETATEMRRVREEATALADELHRLRLAIFSPTVTIDGLRDLVRRGTGANGRP